MAEYTNEIVIARPIDAVRAALDDPELATRWVSGLQKVEPVDGAFAEVGGHARYHFAQHGMEFALDRKVKALAPGRREIAFESPMFSTEVEEELEEVDGGTRVVSRNVISSSGPPIADSMVEDMKARQAADFERLKELLEG
ncbi:MAG: SRPBCC family protein [Acidobacteriota bacterium]